MKQVYSVLMFCFIALHAFAQKVLVNDPNAEIRSVSGTFHGIKIGGGMQLFLSQHESNSVAVSATDPEARDHIVTEIKNGILHISYDGGRNWNSGSKKLKVYVSFSSLESLEASGASNIQVAGTIKVPSFSIEVSGASDFKGAVDVDKLKLELSGASDIKIQGTAREARIQSSGASDIRAYDLAIDKCTAHASGASDIQITVNKELAAQASGASDINWKGDGVITEINTSGASSVKKR